MDDELARLQRAYDEALRALERAEAEVESREGELIAISDQKRARVNELLGSEAPPS